jgi:hypothetical protein
MWSGPGKKFGKGQYLGCFYYAFGDNFSSSATIQVANGAKVIRQYSIKGSQDHQKGTFNKTCLAFYLNKSTKLDLNVKYGSGTVYVRKTKVTKVSDRDNKIDNQYLLQEKDNVTVNTSYGYTD